MILVREESRSANLALTSTSHPFLLLLLLLLPTQPDGRAIAFAMAACNSSKKWDQTLSLYQYAIKMGIDRYTTLADKQALLTLCSVRGERKTQKALTTRKNGVDREHICSTAS